jgi:tetratricopeptide (TPR) repeat protein
MRTTTASGSHSDTAERITGATIAGGNHSDAGGQRPYDWIAPALLAGLLLVATWYQGAFALRHWAPVAVLALTALAAAAAAGGLAVPERWVRVAVGAIWLLTAWALLSATWSESPAGAIEGASRTALYAALFTLPCALLASGRAAIRVGVLVVTGIGAIAAITTFQLLADGTSLFLAGRLDDPVGYRNATACLFALGFWPFVAAAARYDVNPAVRGLALSAATLVAGLAFLTQARGVVLGLGLGAVIALGLGPDRTRRAWVGLIALGGVALASGALLAPYDAFTDSGDAAITDVTTAVNALMLLTIVAFVIGLVGALFDGGLRLQAPARTTLRTLLRLGLMIVAAGAFVVGIGRVGDPIDYGRERLDEFRSLEDTASGQSRLTFGGGQRADLWRVAWDEFGDRPLTGAGQGSYAFAYYAERRTDRNLTDPHSLVFSLLAELGVVGALCLAAFLAALAAAVASAWRAASGDARRHASALLAAGLVGLGQATVDWTWLIPGVTGLSLLALGLGVTCLRRAAGEAARSAGSARPLARALPALGFAAMVIVVGSVYLSDVSLRHARADDGQARLKSARTAAKLSPWSVQARYLKAGALEEIGERAEARTQLQDALRIEPANFVTLALLGDLEARARRGRLAHRYYRQAYVLNPRDVGLEKLADRAF